MTLRLRPATPADADLLFALRNAPETRRYAFTPDPLDRAEHLAWLAHSLALGSRRIWIGEVDGVPVGQIRLDRNCDRVGLIDIATAPEWRGAGHAGSMIEQALRVEPWDLLTLRAEVDPRNRASLSMFARAGFREVDRSDRRIVLERPVAPRPGS